MAIITTRETIANVARTYGWSVRAKSDTGTTLERDTERVTLVFTRTGSVKTGAHYAVGGEHDGTEFGNVGPRTAGKRETVLAWLETERAVDNDMSDYVGERVTVRGEGTGTVSATDGNVTVSLDDGRSVYVESSDVTPVVLDNGTRVEFTRSHIDADGVTTRETHTGTIVGTRAPHPTAPRPRRSYDVIEDGHPADSWEATHPLTFLEDDITPTAKPLASMVMVIDWHRSGETERHTGELRAMRELADRIANVRGGHIQWTFHSDSASGWLLPEGKQSYRDAIAGVNITLAEDERVFSEDDSSTFDLAPADRYGWFLVDTVNGELNLFRLADMRNLNDPERLAVLCGYPGCDAPATNSVALPLPEGRRKDVAVCDTHEQGARFLADTLSEWVDEDTTREPAVSRLFPEDSHDSEPREWERELLAQQDSDAIERDIEERRERDERPAFDEKAYWADLARQDSGYRCGYRHADGSVCERTDAPNDASYCDDCEAERAELEASVARHPAGKRRRAMSQPVEDSERVRPWVGWGSRSVGLAGQIAYTVNVQYPGEDFKTVTFVGSTYGKPGVVTMVWRLTGATEEIQEHVSAPERFGRVLDVDWIRRFYGYGDDSECGIMLADGSQHNMGIVSHCKREMIHGGNHSIHRV